MAVRPLEQRQGRALRAEPLAAPAPEPRPRHLFVVPPGYLSPQARRRRARRLAVLAGVLGAAAMFGVLAFHVVLTQSQLDLQHLQTRATAASVRQQQLRLEAARLESPERVVQDAEHLGMVPPSAVRYLTPTPGAAPKPLAPLTATPRPQVAAGPTAAKAAKPTATTAVPRPATAATKPTSAAQPTTTAKPTPTTAAKPTASSQPAPPRPTR